MNLTKSFWEHRYNTKNIGWDLGEISPPLKAYIDQLTNKDIKILIPGSGNSYEASYLFKKGFKNVFVIDIVQKPLNNLIERIPDFPKDNLICGDFFKLKDTFDLILEQTFFCALDVSIRNKYVTQMASLLKPNGKLVGLLFQFPLSEKGPPFGGSKKEYNERFSNAFNIKKIETAYNSVKPRINNELFIIFEKK